MRYSHPGMPSRALHFPLVPCPVIPHDNPTMKHIFLPIVALTLCAALPTFAEDAKINTLSDKEKSEGWILLFDGNDFKGWHNFHMNTIRPGWEVKDGALV